MKIALIVGEQKGNQLKPKLQSVKDNLDIDVFGNIPKFIDISLRRNSIYDRILVLSSMLNNQTLTDLHNYWGSTSKDTNIVVLCRKGIDEDLANNFMRIFLSTNVTAMLIETTTVQIIAQAVLLSTKELTQKYGISDYLDVEVDIDTYAEPEPEESEIKPVQSTTKSKPEKKGFFSGLFSGKSSKEKHEEAMRAKMEAMNNQNHQEQPQIQNSQQSEPIYSQGNATEFDNTQNQYDSQFSDNSEGYDDFDYSNEDEQFNTEVNENENFSSNFNDTVNNIEDYNDNANETYNDSSIESEDDFDFSETNDEESSSLAESNIEDDFDESSSEMEQESNIVDDFEPDVPETDIDFGDGTVATTSAYEGTEVEDDIDLSSIDLASAEEAYRQKTEQPKVITNTVVKEVVKNVGIGGGSVLKSVCAGRLHKVVIVTGDRGTGVTTTALKLAYEFAKHVPVLYFDCDVDNHGLLNYIDYSQFRNYEPIHMQGVKLCRNSKSFNNCLVGYDTNLDLLTTDFSCDVTDEELEQTQGVVAERSNDYGVVIVDCPVSKLHCISDLVLTGVGVVCVESSKRGFMNMLCRFESSPLQLRYKRSIVSKGLMFLTKCGKDVNVKRLVEYIKTVYEPDDVDYMSMSMKVFNGKLNDSLLNEVLEG